MFKENEECIFIGGLPNYEFSNSPKINEKVIVKELSKLSSEYYKENCYIIKNYENGTDGKGQVFRERELRKLKESIYIKLEFKKIIEKELIISN